MSLRLLSKTYWRGTWVRFREPVDDFAQCQQVTVYAHDNTQVRGLYWTPREAPRPRVAVVCNASAGGLHAPLRDPAAARGRRRVRVARTRGTRQRHVREHEEMVLDVAACVKLAARIAASRGWSGSATAAAGRSAACTRRRPGRAEQRMRLEPGGRPTRFAGATMRPPTEIITAAHTGQGVIMMT